MTDTPDILQKILATKEQEVAHRKQRMAISNLKEIARDIEQPRGFKKSVLDNISAKKPAIIAEIKKASPSKGVIREDFQPVNIAQDYAINGATCLSVLTDKQYFQGAEVYLQKARESCPLPVLRKDFMIDPYQIYESRALGADCILLIVAALNDQQLQELTETSQSLDMDVLVEVHNEQELQRAQQLDSILLGINNRNLRNFETSLDTTLQLKKLLSDDYPVITESGIHTKEDVQFMLQNNVYGFLVGEAFMKAEHPGTTLHALFN